MCLMEGKTVHWASMRICCGGEPYTLEMCFKGGDVNVLEV